MFSAVPTVKVDPAFLATLAEDLTETLAPNLSVEVREYFDKFDFFRPAYSDRRRAFLSRFEEGDAAEASMMWKTLSQEEQLSFLSNCVASLAVSDEEVRSTATADLVQALLGFASSLAFNLNVMLETFTMLQSMCIIDDVVSAYMASAGNSTDEQRIALFYLYVTCAQYRETTAEVVAAWMNEERAVAVVEQVAQELAYSSRTDDALYRKRLLLLRTLLRAGCGNLLQLMAVDADSLGPCQQYIPSTWSTHTNALPRDQMLAVLDAVAFPLDFYRKTKAQPHPMDVMCSAVNWTVVDASWIERQFGYPNCWVSALRHADICAAAASEVLCLWFQMCELCDIRLVPLSTLASIGRELNLVVAGLYGETTAKSHPGGVYGLFFGCYLEEAPLGRWSPAAEARKPDSLPSTELMDAWAEPAIRLGMPKSARSLPPKPSNAPLIVNRVRASVFACRVLAMCMKHSYALRALVALAMNEPIPPVKHMHAVWYSYVLMSQYTLNLIPPKRKRRKVYFFNALWSLKCTPADTKPTISLAAGMSDSGDTPQTTPTSPDTVYGWLQSVTLSDTDKDTYMQWLDLEVPLPQASWTRT